MRILFTTNAPSPYRVDFFNELGKTCDVTVVFERDLPSDRDKSWKTFDAERFEYYILSGINTAADEAICPGIIGFLRKRAKEFDCIIIGNSLTPTGILAILYMRMKKIRYCIEGDGAIVKQENFVKKFFKTFILKNAYLYFSTAKQHDEYYLNYGAPKETIVRYPFSSIKDNDILNDIVTDKEKKEIKQRLGYKYDKIVLSVGRILKLKGFDTILKAFTYIPQNVGCVIVGGKATDEYIQYIKENNLLNVHFVEFQNEAELADYYKMSDIFAFLSRSDVWGLVVNEAMGYGLPIISSKDNNAGLELVENGVNGYIVPTEDADKLAARINEVLSDEEKRQSMGRNNLEKIKDYTIETMASVHMKIFEEYI